MNEKHFVCINCGNSVGELSKKYSNTVKTTRCDKCKQITDKYIEFEEFITLIDALLLSQQAFRHMIYNQSFKLYWKLSLVLLLLESFALCRQKRSDAFDNNSAGSAVYEKGFYMCALQNITDYVCITSLLLLVTALLGIARLKKYGLGKFTLTLVKAVAISNLSKFFLLPILVWRSNTTGFGRSLHYTLVTIHHICSLVLAYEVVKFNAMKKKQLWLTSLMVISSFVVKEYLRQIVTLKMESYFA